MASIKSGQGRTWRWHRLSEEEWRTGGLRNDAATICWEKIPGWFFLEAPIENRIENFSSIALTIKMISTEKHYDLPISTNSKNFGDSDQNPTSSKISLLMSENLDYTSNDSIKIKRNQFSLVLMKDNEFSNFWQINRPIGQRGCSLKKTLDNSPN